MNRKTTFLLAAVFLLVSGLTWGQTRTEVTDVLTRELTGVTGNTYTAWSDVTSNSDAVYAGQSAGGNDAIQLRSNNSNSGIVTTVSGGMLTSVSVIWNDNSADNRTLNIYGSNTAYSAPTELYSADTQGTLLGTIVNGTSTSLAIDGSYSYLGIRSASGALYLDEIDITWSTGGTPPTPTVATPTFSPAAGTYFEAQSVSIACTTQGATIYYTTDGTTPSVTATAGINGTEYTQPLTISETTTVKAIAVKTDMNNSPVATATYTIEAGPTLITIAEAKALAVNEYALVQGVITFVDGKNVYIQDETAGIDLYLNSAVSTLALGDQVQAYGKRSVYNGLIELSGINPSDASQFSVISTGNTLPLVVKTIAEILDDHNSGADILQSTRVQIDDATVGAINTSNNTPITQGQYTINIYKMPVVEGLQEGDIATVIGVVGCFNNPQLRIANATDVTFSHPQGETVATPTFTPEAGTYSEALGVTIMTSPESATIYYTLDGTDPTPNSMVYSEAIIIEETTTIKAYATLEGLEDSEIATAVYTIENVPPTPVVETSYAMITNADALITGEKYIIVGVNNGIYKALGKQANNNRPAVEVTPVNGTITVIPASEVGEDAVYELTLGQEDGNWTLYDAVNGGYLYAASSTANYLKTQAENDANGQWTIEIASDGGATITAQGTNTRNKLRYNSSSSLFSCYGSGQLDVYLYKAGDVPTPTYYSVSVAEGIANGMVMANPTSAPEGATITVTAIPDNNYTLATLTYTLVGSEPVAIDQTTMQFTMPAGDVTINATFVEGSGPAPVSIAEARAMALNTYVLVQGVITFIDGRNVYIQDETAGIDLYLNINTVPSNLALGDMVQAYGKRSVYNGLVELSDIDGGNTAQFNVVSSGNELPLAEKTIAEILEDFAGNNMLQSTRVQIVDATIGAINTNNNTPITQGQSTINIYKMPVVEGLLEGDLVTITGIVGCFNNPQLRVALASDVEFTHPSQQNCATPTFSPAAGTYYETQYVTINCATEGATIFYTTDGTNPTPNSMVYSEAIIIEETTTIKAYATLEDLDDSDIATAVYTITDAPVGGDYVRIADISMLGNGSKVIFAARYNENASEYYAMTAQTSGKPEGVLFTSVAGTAETLPASITNEESTYYWTVTTDGTNYTFTNADGDMLGYTSSTNFSTGGDNINWTIEWATSEASAMVPEYSAFVVTNANVTNRAFALNSNHNYGPYHTQNMASENYNFFIDIFATTGGTPTCATPTFDPVGGTYFAAQTVTINCVTADATIYYTMDGSDPTPNSMVYEEPIQVAQDMTIKAMAMKEGFNPSGIAEAAYTITIGAVTIFEQDWEGEMNGWTFVTVEGSRPWTIGLYNGNHYANANGYNAGANEQWCISPAFNLDNCSDVTLTFMNAKNYTGPDLQLFFSNNYDGSDPSAATWTELSFEMSQGSYEWTESGTIEFTGFSGSNCHIGFKYTSTATEAAAWEVDDIVLMGFTSEPVLNISPLSLTGFSYIVGNGPSAEQSFVVSGFNLTSNVILSLTSNTFEMSDASGDDFEPYEEFEIEPYNGSINEIFYVRMAEGLEHGSYTATIFAESELGDLSVALSGTVMEQAQGGDWNRISSLDDLHDGDQIVIASRFDASVSDGYYAMTAGVSGKPEGVLFTSVTNNGVEALPDEIVMDINTFVWNVTVNNNVITLVNANGDALGYSSSTNFAGNESINWDIAFATSGENAMLPNYNGFVITNQETSVRGIAKNNNNNFGAYHTSNINSADYNFYLDLFVQGGSSTQTVATPVFSVASGTYYSEFDVEIACATQGATIYYTNDGSEPTASSMVYEGAIHVDGNVTLKAIAMMEGYENSSIATVNYIVVLGQTIILSQDWEGEMNGWTFVSTEGNKPWSVNTYNDNKYAYANGYNDSGNNEQWCISPALNLSLYDEATLTFRTAKNYLGPDLELLFSSDYDGHHPATASWQSLEFNKSNGGFMWAESGAISLHELRGTRCYIAFRYTSNLDEGASVWEVDDILILGTGYDDIAETTMDVNIWNYNNEFFVNNQTNGEVEMLVFDLLGQQVLAKTINEGSVRFTYSLSRGMYVVTLQNNKEHMAVKMMVK